MNSTIFKAVESHELVGRTGKGIIFLSAAHEADRIYGVVAYERDQPTFPEAPFVVHRFYVTDNDVTRAHFVSGCYDLTEREAQRVARSR